MGRSSYHQMAYLSSHPAFNYGDAALRCPLCDDLVTLRVADYDRHFLGHDEVGVELAERWLSYRKFEDVAIRRGWLDGCKGGGQVADDRLRYGTCPACGGSVRVVRGRLKPHLARDPVERA